MMRLQCNLHRAARVAQINLGGASTMDKSRRPGDLEVPKKIAPFVDKCPRLMPGESEMQYGALFDLLTEDMIPATNMEWLVLADITGLFWEIRRYNAWKNAILAVTPGCLGSGTPGDAHLELHPQDPPHAYHHLEEGSGAVAHGSREAP